MQSWADVSKQLDPNMPQADYDNLRLKYFHDQVAPKVRQGYSVKDTYTQFLQQTERPKVLSKVEGALVRAGLFSTAAVKAIVPGIDLSDSETLLRGMASRDGISTEFPEGAGKFIGMGLGMAPLFGPSGAAMKGLTSAFKVGAKTAAVVQKIGKGGLAFGTYDALHAENGDRVNAGLRGALIGAATEGVLGGLFGWGDKALKGAVDTTIADGVTPSPKQLGRGAYEAPASPLGAPKQLTGLPTTPSGRIKAEVVSSELTGPFEAQASSIPQPKQLGPAVGFQAEASSEVANILAAQVQEAKKLGYSIGPPVISPGAKGLSVSITDAAGKKSTIPILVGKEADAIGLLRENLEAGGSIDGWRSSPASQSRLTAIIREFADEAEASERPFRMTTPKGKAGEMAKYLNKQGLRGTVVDPQTVLVGPEASWKKAQRIRAANAANKMGASTTTVEEATSSIPEVATPKIGAPSATEGGVAESAATPSTAGEGALPTGVAETATPNSIEEKMRRIGSIRARIRASGAGEGPPVPRADHAELHHLAGEIGTEYGLNRADVGKLALRVVEREAEGKEASAISYLEKYTGRSGKVGEKPAAGFEGGSLKGFKSPGSENLELDADAIDMMDGRLKIRPVGVTKVVPKGSLGGAGITTMDPIRVVEEGADRATLYHEALHEGAIYSEEHTNMPMHVMAEKQTANDLTAYLAKHPDYKGMPTLGLLNEAFTHAAEAIRFADTAKMAELAAADSGVEGVTKFVNATSRSLLESAYAIDNAPMHAFQRRLTDLIRRTDPEIAKAIRRANVDGWSRWFDPDLGRWVARDGEGAEHQFATSNEMWNHALENDPSDFIPDSAGAAYYRRVRGPIVPTGLEPSGNPPSPEVDLPLNLGTSSIGGLLRPTLDFAAKVEARLQKFGFKMGFYDAFANADAAFHKAAPIMDRFAAARDKTLAGVNQATRLAYGEVLATDEKHWPTMATQYGLTSKDLANIRLFKEWDDSLVAAGGPSTIEGLKIGRMVRAGADLTEMESNVWVKAMEHGAIAPDDLHVGRYSKYAIRKMIDSEYMDVPIGRIEELMATKATNGEPLLKNVLYPMQNYVKYMRGIPDASQEILNNFVSNSTKFAEARLGELNKFLPDGYKAPTKLGTPKEIMSKYMLMLYTSGLGGRPATIIRDMFQGANTAAVLGPVAFAKGMAKAMTSAGRLEAEPVLLQGRRIGEFFGDISGDLPASGGKWNDLALKAADKILAPSRWGNNIIRAITYLGEKERALAAVGQYQAGSITADELATQTGLWFLEAAPRSRVISMIATMTPERGAHEVASAMVDALQYPLRMGNQGAIFRTGAGRLFGQYGTWPMNHIEFTSKLAKRAFDTPKQGVPALATWLGINYGAFKAAEGLGIDASKWLFASPAGYTGSPNLELLQNIMAAPEESQKGLEARAAIHSFPINLVPGGVQMSNLYKMFDEGDTNLARALGFKLDEGTERDMDEWLALELGFRRKQ